MWQLLLRYDLIKIPKTHLKENLHEIFLMLVDVVLPDYRSLIHYFLTWPLTFPWALTKFNFRGIYQFSTFRLAYFRKIFNTSILNFWGFSFNWECYGFEQAFFPHSAFCIAFLPHILAHLWLRCKQEHPIQDLPLCLLSWSCPLWLTSGIELPTY